MFHCMIFFQTGLHQSRLVFKMFKIQEQRRKNVCFHSGTFLFITTEVCRLRSLMKKKNSDSNTLNP